MASCAVSSVLYLRDAAGIRLKHVQLHTSTTEIQRGDAPSFREWEFRTRLGIAGKTGDQYIEAIF